MYLSLRQYADIMRREAAQEYRITLAEIKCEQPDAHYVAQHLAFVELLASSGITFSKRQLDDYYATYGSNALRVLLKFNPIIAPLYYVHPDFRNKTNA